MAREEGYNGFRNYQTWAVNLWLNNDPFTYSFLRTEAAARSRSSFAEYLEEMVEESRPDSRCASMYEDLLTHALQQVDWYEIADIFREDLR